MEVVRTQQHCFEVMEKEVSGSICGFAPGSINVVFVCFFLNCYSFSTSIKLNYK